MNKVYVAPCPEYKAQTVREALLRIIGPTGFLERVKPGMCVVIKANLVSMMRPDQAATTHPVPLAELTKLLIERGAEVLVGDSPGGLYNAAYVGAIYRAAGMNLVKEAGAELNSDYSQHSVYDEKAVIAKEFTCTSYLDRADLLINFCKLKTHGMMGMSAAVKNLFGVIPGTMKPEYHYRFPNPSDFSDMLIDLNEHFHCDLNLVDAVVGMEGNGPTAGTPRQIGCLLAASRPYALDLACARIIGLEPMQIPTVQASIKRGFLRDAEDVEIVGDLAPFLIPDYELVVERKGFDFTGTNNLFGKVRGKVLSSLLNSRPELVPELCVGCKQCYNICPAKAITMKENKPVIDRDHCIRCFCCQEFCPKSAMKVKRTWAARLLS